jgi:hypothetical protein
MASNKTFRFGPVALTTTLTTNLLNPPAASGGVNAGSSSQYIVLKHLRITNKTASAATFSLWLGATGANAAGTEVIGSGADRAGQFLLRLVRATCGSMRRTSSSAGPVLTRR